MKTMVRFVCDGFNKTEQKETFINPDNFGDDLMLWFRDELRARGLSTDDEPGQEDFGWYLNFSVNEQPHCVVGGLEDADEKRTEPQHWVLWIERNVGFWKSIFGQRTKNISPEAINVIDQILKTRSDVTGIEWMELP